MMAFSSGVMRYFYPRPPRGRRRENIQCEAKLLAISIHALREEGDVSPPFWGAAGSYFYPRPPRGGRRSAAGLEGQAGRFLSTPSARRATPMSRSICARRSKFLSTPSARRATLYNHRHAHCCQISIHALREEGDNLVRWCLHLQRNFYPRPPRGGRRMGFPSSFTSSIFLSTPSARRATLPKNNGGKNHEFLSTPSARRATTDAYKESGTYLFLSTPSARRAT